MESCFTIDFFKLFYQGNTLQGLVINFSINITIVTTRLKFPLHRFSVLRKTFPCLQHLFLKTSNLISLDFIVSKINTLFNFRLYHYV